MLVANLDGDAQSDLVLRGEVTWVVLGGSQNHTAGWLTQIPLFANDFNEDGLDDLVVYDGSQVNLVLSNP